jgi:dihydrofolate reductase
MKAIVAVDLNWGIGYKGNLLQRIPADMKYFKEKTIGKVVIMGRETFESLPGKEPLKERVNIVLSRDEQFRNEKLIICRSLEELFLKLERYDSEDVFVIGGESVYTQLLPYCTVAYVTRIENTYPADKFFTNLDQHKSWKLAKIGDAQSYDAIAYRFLKYRNQE